MKKPLLKVLLPITALLLSACNPIEVVKNFFADFTQTEKEEETETEQDTEPESKQETETETDPEPEVDPKENPEEDPEPIVDPPVEITYPTKISIRSSLMLKVGDEEELTVEITPNDVDYKVIEWSTNDEDVVTVEDGAVTAVGAGKTTIVASSLNKDGEAITSECSVVVADPSLVSKTELDYDYDDYTAYSAYGSDNCPLNGEPKLLIVPIWFNDSDTFIDESKQEDVKADIEAVFIGTNEETGWRSVKTYYEEESFGKMSLTGTVTDWYEIDESYVAYKNDLDKVTNLVSSSITWFFTNNPGENRKSYDSNGDGYLDGVMLIYAAPDYSSLGESSNYLWAFAYNVYNSSPSKVKPNPKAFFWGSYDFMYEYGQNAKSRTGKTNYGRGDTRFCNIDSHAFIHEMGHVLGVPDYYDYSGQYSPAGSFSMQDMNVGGHDPYSVMAYGWANPYIPTDTTTIIIDDFQSSHDVILLANHEVNSPFDEYLLLELYSPTGLNEFDAENAYKYYYPQGPMDIGLRVWHVDARLTQYTNFGWSSKLITDPTKGSVSHAMTNTYYLEDSSSNDYLSPLGDLYSEFNILQLIRCDGDLYSFNSDSLFYEGMSFDTDTYEDQFVRNGKMNDGEPLGWSFTVDVIDGTSAAITVEKL